MTTKHINRFDYWLNIRGFCRTAALASERYTTSECQSSIHVMREVSSVELKALIASEKVADVTWLVGEQQRGGDKKRTL